MTIQTLADQWQDFDAKILVPIGAPDFQRLEMRKAFYAGAAAVLSIGSQIAEQIESDDDGAKALATLESEVLDFALDLSHPKGQPQ